MLEQVLRVERAEGATFDKCITFQWPICVTTQGAFQGALFQHFSVIKNILFDLDFPFLLRSKTGEGMIFYSESIIEIDTLFVIQLKSL